MPFDLDTLKKSAYSGKKPIGLDVHESVIYHTMRYCYRAYKNDPTDKTKERLKQFLNPVIEFHFGRKS